MGCGWERLHGGWVLDIGRRSFFTPSVHYLTIGFADLGEECLAFLRAISLVAKR